ncbi:MAG: excinuclease ABC subunit UvrC [Chloroflexi bacterium]|nr:MAG: excinuclease ABC subunit UvrC [Chloroflexota bacterium]TMB72829.1 MAG: excinuclease ABC subunit UvrC [Chloroflexota bacterium]TMC25806.1 MAG: excinuclease ABC subunit UvrC [Chloroflexota bacterium]TMC34717.1 MAG: excinuclease ABC subunit UvrC [Chloroflexota bacterium]TMC58662.1 MAG: excinuclease ABC subunit UvrC [Chloroflexota bacterium]
MKQQDRRASLEAQVASFPTTPGVYLFKDAKGRVLYVGKADSLRDRVRNYFGPSLDVRFVRLVERAERVEYVLTGSISESYLLENNLIKQHKPRYNIRLKDDKSYPYVKITLGEDFPRILRTRILGDRSARYFGPFANAKSVDESLDLLQKLFPYRTCKLRIDAGDDGRGKTVPPSALPGGRPCLLFHLKRCTAPCVGNTTKDEYRATIDRSVLFLEGRYETLARDARKEMAAASEALQFERAALLRDRLVAIDRTLDRQEVHAYKGDDFDVLAAAIDEGDAVVQVFRVRDGTVVGRDHFALEGSEGASPADVVASFLRLHYSAAGALPPEIVSPVALPETEQLEAFLSERRGGPVRVLVPQRGRKRHLAELAARNAADALEQERVRWLADRGKTETALVELQEALGLEGPPKRIECYDVSHVQGTSVVSSMVVFEDGRPAKSQYRRFRARVQDRNDDFANMRETLRRRFARSSQADETTGSAWALPDLVILDGGKGQLSAGLDALADAGRLQIPIVALAKEREELFLPNRADPIVLPRNSQGMYLVQRIRDEAHRFAITYHQSVRAKRAVHSILDDVAGVGPAKKRALLRKFGSVRGMREAPLDDLSAVAGVGPALAKRIKEALEA